MADHENFADVDVMEIWILRQTPTVLQRLQLDLYVTRRYAPWWSRWPSVLHLRWQIWRLRRRERKSQP